MNIRTLGLMAILFMLMFIGASMLNNVNSESIAVQAAEPCRELVEEAAKTVDGVIHAEWNTDDNELNVVYDVTKTDIETIESAIAGSGFPTPNFEVEDGAIEKMQRKCRSAEQARSDKDSRRIIIINNTN